MSVKVALYGRPSLDMFASLADAQLPTFMSRYVTPTAWRGGHPLLPMDGPCYVLVSAVRTNSHGPTQTPGHTGGPPTCRPVLNEPAVVSTASAASERPPLPVPTGAGPHPAEWCTSPPGPGLPVASWMTSVGLSLQAAGFSAETTDIAAAARRPTTLKTYDSHLERYYV